MRSTLLIVVSALILVSCQEDLKESQYLSCDEELDYLGHSDIYLWENSITENDTAFVQVFFDTLLFDAKDIVNTISFTWFKDKVKKDFDWNRYIERETSSISNNFRLIKNGHFRVNEIERYWYMVKDEEHYFYIEYILTNPLTIITYCTSKKEDLLNDEFCILQNMASQAKRLTP